MIDATGIRRIEDLGIDQLAFVGLDLDGQIALGDLHPSGAVAVDTHGAEVHHMDILAALDDGGEQVVGGVEVVIDRITLVPTAFHRVGRGALFSEMHHRLGLPVVQQIKQALIVACDIDAVEGYGLAADVAPGVQALAEWPDWREGLAFELDVDFATGEVIDDGDIVAEVGEVKGGGPATEAVAAEDHDAHVVLRLLRFTNCDEPVLSHIQYKTVIWPHLRRPKIAQPNLPLTKRSYLREKKRIRSIKASSLSDSSVAIKKLDLVDCKSENFQHPLKTNRPWPL